MSISGIRIRRNSWFDIDISLIMLPAFSEVTTDETGNIHARVHFYVTYIQVL